MEFSESTEAMFGKRQRGDTRKTLFIGGIVALIIGFVIGILIGRFAVCPDKDIIQTQQSLIPEKIIQDGNPEIGDEIMNQISAENIRNYLRDMSELPHLAGTDADLKQAEELKDFWATNGLDETFLTPYDILLSYPNTDDPDSMNRLFVYNSSDKIEWQSDLFEPILHPSENRSNVVPPFNAFSAPGDINSTDLVYVNYGRVEDYRWLVNNSMNVTGKIALARYGRIFRGDKVHQAWLHGATGIIIYSDPADYAVDGEDSKVYPEDWWLPPSGTQRGTVFLGMGDPLTPGYPATDAAYRLEESDPRTQLARIPAHPIGYGVAKTLLQFMDGDEVPADWRGALNITYRLGGKLKENRIVRMRISTQNYRRKTYNVIGIIRGEIEPDRYVLLGNHRDAWVFGAIDPSSGTAVMKEVSRVMGNMVKSGKWRPRRSIVFCSWGAEEYGLIGSTEWIEQYIKNLVSRSVAYLNVDIAVEGNFTMRGLATPLMYHAFYEATKKVSSPDPNDISANVNTLYDKMMKAIPDGNNPTIESMGSGSDYAPFIQRVGLPCVDLSYIYDTQKYHISSYPLYHSKYETFYAVDNLLDRGFKYHKAVGQTWAEIARNLADSLIIPFNVGDYATKLDGLIRQLDTDYGQLLRSKGIAFDVLYNTSRHFAQEVNRFKSLQQNVDKNDPFAIRRINDQLMQLERAFIDPAGLPNRPLARHILFAESSVNSYAGSSFPGLVDSLYEIERSPDEENRWEIVKHHFSVIVFCIESAASTLRDVSTFM